MLGGIVWWTDGSPFDFLTLIIRFNRKRNTGVNSATFVSGRCDIDDRAERGAGSLIVGQNAC